MRHPKSITNYYYFFIANIGEGKMHGNVFFSSRFTVYDCEITKRKSIYERKNLYYYLTKICEYIWPIFMSQKAKSDTALIELEFTNKSA